jgi:hypothetical protein
MSRTTKYAVEINGMHFANGESLKQYLREIIDGYIWPGCPSEVPMSDEHSSFFIELVRLKTPSRIPDGQYVRQVLRATREGQIGRHVCFVYGDGNRDMIGWSGLCSSGKNLKQVVNDALRHAIFSQTSRVYALAFDDTSVDWRNGDDGVVVQCGSRIYICPKSGLRLSATGEFADDIGVVHHDGTPYADIKEAWMSAHGHTPESLPVVEMQVGGWSLAPGEVRDSWEAFHAMHANLVVVSKRWHDNHHGTQRKKKREKVDVVTQTPANG